MVATLHEQRGHSRMPLTLSTLSIGRLAKCVRPAPFRHQNIADLPAATQDGPTSPPPPPPPLSLSLARASQYLSHFRTHTCALCLCVPLHLSVSCCLRASLLRVFLLCRCHSSGFVPATLPVSLFRIRFIRRCHPSTFLFSIASGKATILPCRSASSPFYGTFLRGSSLNHTTLASFYAFSILRIKKPSGGAPPAALPPPKHVMRTIGWP